MKTRLLGYALAVAIVAGFGPRSRADEPIIPPVISSVSPAGMQRGTTATFTVLGRNIGGAKEVLFDAPGLHAKLGTITDIPEKIAPPRPGVDQGAQVPLGRKQTTTIEVTAAPDVKPGLHWLRIHTPLGTTNRVAVDVGALPEIHAMTPSAMDAPGSSAPQPVQLPATLIGTIATPGAANSFEFTGTAGQEVVFQLRASELGSSLQSLLTLRDASGTVLAQAGTGVDEADAVLTSKLASAGKYTITVSDRERGGGMDHYYRLNAGSLPYIKSAFPLGARIGQKTEVALDGVNLGNTHELGVTPQRTDVRGATMPLGVTTSSGDSLNQIRLAVGEEPELVEREPNNAPAAAQAITLPAAIEGHINGIAPGAPDEDYYRFHARKGEQITIEVAAARFGSALDSVIEILDWSGNSIPRATVRCLNETTTTLTDRDSRSRGIRLTSTSGLHEGDYVMVGDELDQIAIIPDQPDADVSMKGIRGLREAFLGTSPDVHAINTPVYRAQILPPDAKFPSNGLPVFHLTWRNDDGGPDYGADSRLDFTAPADGDYLLRLRDVRGLQGPDFAYRLTFKDAQPDYELDADTENPNIPQGGSVPIGVTADRSGGYEGPINIEVTSLPKGITARPSVIPEGQESTVVVLSAAADYSPAAAPAPIEIVGRAEVGGHELRRVADPEAPLRVVSVIPPPDLVVTTEARAVSLEPGKDVTVTLHIDRKNGFKGRVPCDVQNLPPGVRVVNVGLNGVLVTETQTTRTFTLHAESWAKPIEQPIYVVGVVESNASTMHASPALMLKVGGPGEVASNSSAHPKPPGASAAGAPGTPPKP